MFKSTLDMTKSSDDSVTTTNTKKHLQITQAFIFQGTLLVLYKGHVSYPVVCNSFNCSLFLLTSGEWSLDLYAWFPAQQDMLKGHGTRFPTNDQQLIPRPVLSRSTDQ